MQLVRVQRWRRYAGWLGMLAALLLVAAMLDIVIVRQRSAFNVLEVLPGQEVPIDGPLAEKTAVRDLTYTTDCPDLELIFDDTFSGFWLGGQMWRGRLRVRPTAAPGKYLLQVQPRQPQQEVPPLPYRIRIHADLQSWCRSSPSLFWRYLGFSPWWGAATGLGLFLGTVALTFWLSGKVDQAMAREGVAEIYAVRRLPQGCELAFGLGSEHGLREGSRVLLLDPQGNPVEEVEVVAVSPQDAVAVALGSPRCTPGYKVKLAIQKKSSR